MELNTNIEERIKTQFASTTKVLSFNTLRSRLNNGKTTNDTEYISSKQLSSILHNSESFTPVDPITIGCNKWYDARLFNKKRLKSQKESKNELIFGRCAK